MELNASNLREARLHAQDIVDCAIAKMKAAPNDPNVEVLLSKDDIEDILLLVEVAEVYAEERATRRINEKIKRQRERGEIK